jgi:two-component system sensor kinase FixL
LREHQQDLARAERINSMGEMASALAHELNQPLAAISSYVQGCMRRLNTDQYQKDELLKVMEKAAQQSMRAGEIIHRMKDFVRKGKLSIELTNVNKLIKETLAFMQNELEKHQVEIEFILSDNLPQLKLDAIQIQQAITNLIRNALQAMIEASTHYPKVTIRSCLINKNHIDIEDNGPGFGIEDAQLLLQPYFTTKKHGMGMGLSISRTIIEAHGGKLLAKNNAHGGAMFKIILPIEGKSE